MDIQKEDHEILKNIIHSSLSNYNTKNNVELVIRPDCNQKCKYCYLIQHGKKSYPKRISYNEILNNLDLVINEFIKQNYNIDKLDLFAGDLFFDNLFFDIIPIIEKYYKILSNKNINGTKKYTIMIPCNMSFCEDNEKIQKVKDICNRFLKNYNTRILFSYSTDGFFSIDSREQRNISEEYFNKIFALCGEMKWGVHPMISYESIDNAINNYEWFKNKYSKFDLKQDKQNNFPTYLEVRNDGWDDHSLKKYEEFLLYFFNDIFHNIYKSDLQNFFENYFNDYKIINNKLEYTPNGAYGKINFKNQSRLSCSMGTFKLMINIQNLTFIPCHRLAYPELTGGQYEVRNNKIIDIKASETINAYLHLKYYNPKAEIHCITCNYNPICMKGCLGSQYEKFGNATIVNSNVCKMLKIKYDTSIKFFHSINLFHYIFQNYPDYPDLNNFKKLLIDFGYAEYEKY